MLDFTVAIPARFASTRLPGKPLLTIGGKPMIRHVAERALAAGARDAESAAFGICKSGRLAGSMILHCKCVETFYLCY